MRHIGIPDPEIKGQAAVAGQVRDRHTGRGPSGQQHRLAKVSAIYVNRGPVLRVERPPIAGAVIVIPIEVLEAQRIGIICHQLIVCHIIPQIQTGHLGRRQAGAVPPVLQLIVVDVRHVPHLLIIVDGVVISVIDRNESRRILHVYQIVLIRAVVYRDVVPAVVLVIVEIVLGILILSEIVVVVIIGGIIVIPGLEIRAVAVLVRDIVGRVLIQEVRQLDIRLIVIGIVGSIMDRMVITVNDLGIGRIAATIIIRHISRSIYNTSLPFLLSFFLLEVIP